MQFPLPELGEGVYEAELVRWLVQVGDPIKRGQTLMEVLTDKATMEVPAPFTGTITSLDVAEGQPVKVGQVVLAYEATTTHGNGSASPATSAPVAAEPTPSATPPRPSVSARPVPSNGSSTPSVANLPPAAPSVRHLARKLGIDLARVRGSGPAGRILLEDLTPHLQPARLDGTPEPRQAGSGVRELLELGQAGSHIPLRGIRRSIAEHMVRSVQTVPHYAYIDEVEISQLVQMRQSLREEAERRGVKLTYLAFVVKAATRALQEVPIVNSTLDEASQMIQLHTHYHIGVAVTTKAGLLVPVVRDAERKDVLTIAREIDRLSSAARAGRARPEELRGSTFTVTSVGNIGGLISTPIINVPETAILGLGKIVKRPVYDEHGQIRPADLIYLSFSFDHRVIDGAVGAHFGNRLAHYLRQPAALLLGPE